MFFKNSFFQEIKQEDTLTSATSLAKLKTGSRSSEEEESVPFIDEDSSESSAK